jgi:hypothetical protein
MRKAVMILSLACGVLVIGQTEAMAHGANCYVDARFGLICGDPDDPDVWPGDPIHQG